MRRKRKLYRPESFDRIFTGCVVGCLLWLLIALAAVLVVRSVRGADTRRGVALSSTGNCDWFVNVVGVQAYYSWLYNPAACPGIFYTPMISWSPDMLPSPDFHASQYDKMQEHKIALALNECNLSTQCATDPWAAASHFVNELLPQARLVAPAETYIVGGATMDPCGVDWMAEFATEVKALNGGSYPPELRGWGWHLYPDLGGPGLNWRGGWASNCPGHAPSLASWQSQVDAVNQWRFQYAEPDHEFWLTEWGWSWDGYDLATRQAHMETILNYFDGPGRWWRQTYYFTHHDAAKESRNLVVCPDVGCERTALGDQYAAWPPQPWQGDLHRMYAPVSIQRAYP